MSNNSSTSDAKLSLPLLEKRERIFKESLITLYRDTLISSHQQTYSYYILETKPFAVVILAFTPDEQLILNEEYRHPTGKILLSCPGGYFEEGEDPIEAAKRELLEETGYSAHDFQLMGKAFPYAGLSGQQTFYVMAKRAFFAQSPQHEPAECIRTSLKSKKDLDRLVAKDSYLDGTLCTALFFYQQLQPKAN